MIGLSNMYSNVDFYIYGIILLGLILCKISKWVDILKYADKVCALGIVIFSLIKIIKVFIHIFKDYEIDEEYKEEIVNREEIKKIDKLKMINYGGYRKIEISVQLKEDLKLISNSIFP